MGVTYRLAAEQTVTAYSKGLGFGDQRILPMKRLKPRGRLGGAAACDWVLLHAKSVTEY
jgi:hypothetical protein